MAGQTQAGLISPVGFFTEKKGEKKHDNEEWFAAKEHTTSKLRARLKSIHRADGGLSHLLSMHIHLLLPQIDRQSGKISFVLC